MAKFGLQHAAQAMAKCGTLAWSSHWKTLLDLTLDFRLVLAALYREIYWGYSIRLT